MIFVYKPLTGASGSVLVGAMPAVNPSTSKPYNLAQQANQTSKVVGLLSALAGAGLITDDQSVGGTFATAWETPVTLTGAGGSGLTAGSRYKFSAKTKQNADAVCNVLAQLDNISVFPAG